MSKYIHPASVPPPLIDADQIKPEWMEVIRAMIQRDGNPIRGGEKVFSIEVKSLTDNVWRPIMLPGNGYQFTTEEGRNRILGQITRR